MASAERLEISQVAAGRTHRLRAVVLHGGTSPEVARIPGEDHPDVATYAAQDAAERLAHVADRGGGVAWCNATPGGAAVFTHLGFATVGLPWEDPEFGPNVRMRRTV
ncbi:hypothetical protein ACIA03_02040 [Nocardioides sp. NPDC051685]|uniref:hypothetical protein n=1 Tax=Nocardioides sp. NPDC051685 TaxID=3364334 RepID=UPI0037B47CDD